MKQLLSEFSASPPVENLAASPAHAEQPTTWLWCAYFWAQHLDLLGKYEDALLVADKMLEHTPTLIEAYFLKAKLFKVWELFYISFLSMLFVFNLL